MTTAPAMSAAPSSAPAATPSPAPASSTPTSTPSSASTSPSGTPKPSGATSPGSEGKSSPAGSTDQSPAAAAKVAEAVRKHKLKVNGKEMEFDEPEVLRRAQLAESADQRFQEAAKARKEAAQVLEILKSDPVAAMQQLGLNPREFAEKYLAGELQKEMLTPEQRELQELREKNVKWESDQKEATTRTQKEAQDRDFQVQQDRAAQEYDTTITDVLSKSNLPKTPETVKRVASLLKSALEKGYDLDVPTAVDMVKQGYLGDIQSLLSGLDGENLVKMIGPKLLKELRKYDLATIKSKLNPQVEAAVTAAPQNSAPRAKAEKSSYLNQDDWISALRKKAGVE